SLADEDVPMRTLDAFLCCAEAATDVPEPCGREQCVADGVAEGIPVAVPGEARLVRPVKPTQPERPVIIEGVDVHADTGAGGGGRSDEGLRPAQVPRGRDLERVRV